jgi:Na+/H+ antiporter NhaD/arsenite permease-like protein
MINEIVSGVIFAVILILIFTDKVNRLIAAAIGAVLMVAAGMLMGFYDQEQALAAVDFNTIALLFGMMVLVALLEPTGFFQYLAIMAARFSRAQPIRLLVILGAITTVLSMFLDNVTTVVLIAPITILICEILGIQASPYLIAEAILSNTGGTATLVGDPPNVLIASAAGFSFVDFLIYSLPIVMVSWFAVLLLLRYLFRSELAVVPSNAEALLQLDPTEALNDAFTARQVLFTLVGTLVLFFFQEPLKMDPAFIAMIGATVAMIWVKPPVKEMFERIEWTVLFFFIGLFIMVGGLEASGLLHELVKLIMSAHNVPPILFGFIALWGVAVLSAVVDNVPITIALLPVVLELGELGMDVTPLWWALVFGAGFGGNGSIIGSTANIVVVTLSERTRDPITAALWSKRGLPAMLLACLVASILYLFIYRWLSS